MKKRMLALMLALCMVMALPVAAFASAPTDEFTLEEIAAPTGEPVAEAPVEEPVIDQDAPTIQTTEFPIVYVGDQQPTVITLQATPGAGQTAVAWSISGSAPQTSFDQTAGTITVDTAALNVGDAGTYPFTLVASDGSGTTTQVTIGLTIAVRTKITTSHLNDGLKNSLYSSGTFTFTGVGSGTMVWSIVSGSLPNGMDFGYNPSTQVATLTGTPSEAGSFTFKLRLTTPYGVDEKEFTLVIQDTVLSKPVITTSPVNLGAYDIGDDFSVKLSATGGGSMVWALGTNPFVSPQTTGPATNNTILMNTSDFAANGVLTSDTLLGLQLGDTADTLADNTPRTFTFTATASNTASGAGGAVSEPVTFTITLRPAAAQKPAVTTTTLADAIEARTYSGPLSAQGATTPSANIGVVTWAIASGSLPSGMTLNANTGVIEGAPAIGSAGTYEFSVTATNAIGTSVAQDLTLRVLPQLVSSATFVTEQLAPAETGDSTYSYADLRATGGGTYTWSAGANIDPELTKQGFVAGNINVTPTSNAIRPDTTTVDIDFTGIKPGDYWIELTVQNQILPAETKKIPITVVEKATTAAVITTTALDTGYVGMDYSFQMEATGDGAIVWSEGLNNHILPTLGLEIDSATGVIFGTPTRAGTFGITIQCSNSKNTTPSIMTYTLEIKEEYVEEVLILNNSLPVASEGVGYGFTLTALGAAPIEWYLDDNSYLPDGVAFDENGNFEGVPAVGSAGTYQLNITAFNDVSFDTVTLTLKVDVSDPPATDFPGWHVNSKGWFYYDSDRNLVTGFATIDGNSFYFGADGYMATGWALIDGAYYYFGDNGIMLKGWLQEGANYYYFGADGKMVANGWYQNAVGDWFFFNNSGIMLSNIWYNDGNFWYFFSVDGVMQTGWSLINGAWYYFVDAGQMVANSWLSHAGGWFYLSSSGAMVTGTQVIGGVSYTFDTSGVWVA